MKNTKVTFKFKVIEGSSRGVLTLPLLEQWLHTGGQSLYINPYDHCSLTHMNKYLCDAMQINIIIDIADNDHWESMFRWRWGEGQAVDLDSFCPVEFSSVSQCNQINENATKIHSKYKCDQIN